MKNGYVHVTFVIDESGSMSVIKQTVISGFNTLMATQAEIPGECSVSLYTFADLAKAVHIFSPLASIPVLSGANYNPGGSTALYDALGYAIKETGVCINSLGEEAKPEIVQFYIITDGMENASTEYSQQSIAQMIKHQQEVYSWRFEYIGANQDAFAVGAGLNIASTQSYNATEAGTKAMYGNVARGLTESRGSFGRKK